MGGRVGGEGGVQSGSGGRGGIPVFQLNRYFYQLLSDLGVNSFSVLIGASTHLICTFNCFGMTFESDQQLS